MKRVWILQLKKQDCATGILFWRDSRNGVVIGLAGACKGERRKLLIPSPLMSRDPESMYIELLKSLDFENNTLIDGNSFCRKSVFNLELNVLLKS